MAPRSATPGPQASGAPGVDSAKQLAKNVPLRVDTGCSVVGNNPLTRTRSIKLSRISDKDCRVDGTVVDVGVLRSSSTNDQMTTNRRTESHRVFPFCFPSRGGRKVYDLCCVLCESQSQSDEWYGDAKVITKRAGPHQLQPDTGHTTAIVPPHGARQIYSCLFSAFLDRCGYREVLGATKCARDPDNHINKSAC